jgi:hypothetical protein
VTTKKIFLLVFTFISILFLTGCQSERDDDEEELIPPDFVLLNQALNSLQSANQYEIIINHTTSQEPIFNIRYIYDGSSVHVITNHLFPKPFYVIVNNDITNYCYDQTGLANYICQEEPLIAFMDFDLASLFNAFSLEFFDFVDNKYSLTNLNDDVLQNLPIFSFDQDAFVSLSIQSSLPTHIDINYTYLDNSELTNDISLRIRNMNTASISLPDFFNQLQLDTLINPILSAETYTVSYRRNGVDHLGQFTDIQFIKFDNARYYVWQQFKGPAVETYYKQVDDTWQQCRRVVDIGWQCVPCPLNNPYKNHLAQYQFEAFDLSWFNPYGQTFVIDEQFVDEMAILVSDLVPSLNLVNVIIKPTTLGTEISFQFRSDVNQSIFENIVITISDINQTVIDLPAGLLP